VAASTAAATPAPIAMRRHFASPGAPYVTTAGVAGLPSASANCAAVANRSAGSFASARRMHASTWGGMVSRTMRGGAGRSLITLATIACTVAPVNGGAPVSIS
jgi:hypothetical protein